MCIIFLGKLSPENCFKNNFLELFLKSYQIDLQLKSYLISKNNIERII